MSFHEPIPQQNTHPASALQVNFSSAELPVYGGCSPRPSNSPYVTRQMVLDRLTCSLAPTIAEADRVSAICYLETFGRRNVSFYQRLGFGIEVRFKEPTTGADYAVMVRYPAAPMANGAR